jgi:hypothetical protein
MASLLIVLMMEAVRTSETLVNSYRFIQSYNPEDSHFVILFKLPSERVSSVKSCANEEPTASVYCV